METKTSEFPFLSSPHLLTYSTHKLSYRSDVHEKMNQNEFIYQTEIDSDIDKLMVIKGEEQG